MLTSKVNFRVINSVLGSQVRGIQSNDSLLDECTRVRNRNPRNLEFLTIARKPLGYWLEKYKKTYWHKLVFTKNSRYITLQLHHFENGPVITVSTKDWPLKKQLNKLSDTAAYVNLAKVFAQRCLESGITSMVPMPNESKNTKLNLLLEELKNSGLFLKEPQVFRTPYPWHKDVQEKPWEIFP